MNKISRICLTIVGKQNLLRLLKNKRRRLVTGRKKVREAESRIVPIIATITHVPFRVNT